MAQIFIQVQNDTADNAIAHVIDRFGGAKREVDNSPFALAPTEVSPAFMVNADGNQGAIDWSIERGPALSDVPVADAQIVPMN